MSPKSIQQTLRETFLSPDKEVWKQFASQELEGRSSDEVLSWNTEEQIRFFAYYDASDEKKNNLSQNFRITVADDPYFGPAKWLNLPPVSVTSEKNANQTALQHLTNGADGILFSFKQKINFEDLLQGIDWRYCSLFFTVGGDANVLQELNNYIEKNNLSNSLLSSGLFWDNIPNSDFTQTKEGVLKNILPINSSTPVNEISEALSRGVEFVEKSKNHSFEFFKSIGFSIPAHTNFLECIAKLKALRFLWFQVAHSYGHSSYQTSNLHLHARSEKWTEEKFQPHGNLLKATSSAMASVVGGANAITIYPEDSESTMMNRVARNVTSLLREESHIDKVADPSAGAYVIDVMTEEFAKRAWTNFQREQMK